MSRLERKIKNKGIATLNLGGNVGKITLGSILGIAATELTFFGLKQTETDVNVAKDLYKFKKDPDVYQVKSGFFKKPYNVNINPITGEMVKDKTGKAPVNKKPIKLF